MKGRNKVDLLARCKLVALGWGRRLAGQKRGEPLVEPTSARGCPIADAAIHEALQEAGVRKRSGMG